MSERKHPDPEVDAMDKWLERLYTGSLSDENEQLKARVIELEKRNAWLEGKLKRAKATAEKWFHNYGIANPHVALARCALLAHGSRREAAVAGWNDACDHIERLIHQVELSTLRDLKDAGAPVNEQDWPAEEKKTP